MFSKTADNTEVLEMGIHKKTRINTHKYSKIHFKKQTTVHVNHKMSFMFRLNKTAST